MKAVDQQTGEDISNKPREDAARAGCRRVRHQTVTKTAAFGPPFLFVDLAA